MDNRQRFPENGDDEQVEIEIEKDIHILEDPEDASYFLEPDVQTFSSGCTLLNHALGGGWPLNRMFNVIGDSSTGKTLVMIEAAVQFLRHFNGDADVVFCEAEAAFDKKYAAALGMPVDKVRFISDEWIVTRKGKKQKYLIKPEDYSDTVHELHSEGIFTVEQLELALTCVVDKLKRPTLFMVDSYDALSDDKEQERAADDHATYGTQKAKHGSAMFRKNNQRMAKKGMTLGIVSQTRAKIGVTFGDKTTRNGGACLDFYSTHCVWLQHIEQLKRTRKKVERVYGILVKAKVKKNKIGMPHRVAEFPIHFGYGIEDVISMVNWLLEVEKQHLAFESQKAANDFLRGIDKLTQTEYDAWQVDLVAAVREGWQSIERDHLPARSKYAD